MRKLAIFLVACGFAACEKPPVPNNGRTVLPVAPSLTEVAKILGTFNVAGGVGLRCGGKFEMLDLFEARNEGRRFIEPGSQAEAIGFVASRVAGHFWAVGKVAHDEHIETVARDVVTPMFEGRAFLNPRTEQPEFAQFVESLPLSNDFANYHVPSGCKLEQVAAFSDESNRFKIVTSAWAGLNWMSKAVLVAHELIYMQERREGLHSLWPDGVARNQESSRRFVARLLSVEPLSSKSSGVPDSGGVFHCTSKGDESKTEFFAFTSRHNEFFSLVFKTLLGRSSLYQLRSDLSDSMQAADVKAVGSEMRTRLRVNFDSKAEQSKISFVFVNDGQVDPVSVTQDVTCDLH